MKLDDFISQPFDFDDIHPDATECKPINQKTKENEKRLSFDLKSNEGNLVPTKYGNEAEDDLMIASKLGSKLDIADLEHDDKAQVRNFVEPVSNPLEELDSCQNSKDSYVDNYIKDVCVDKAFFKNSIDEKAFFEKFFPIETHEYEESKKDNVGGIGVPFSSALDLTLTDESPEVPKKHHVSEDLIQRDENATKNLDVQNREMVLPGGTISLKEVEAEQPRHSLDEGDGIELEFSGKPDDFSEHEASVHMVEETESASAAIDEANADDDAICAINEANADDDAICVGYSKFVPLDSVAGFGDEEYHQVGGLTFDDTQNYTSRFEVGMSSNQAFFTSQESDNFGEASFSAVGRMSSRISYSGPIPFSGSISHRSDSSTTSTRSFAFPILQSEWNSSPVRMAEPDPRNRPGWRKFLLCCRF